MARSLLMLCATLFVVALNLTPISESDFWLQQKLGGMTRETGTIPRTVLFAFTEARDHEFIAHEWLPCVVSSALYDVVSYRGMIVFKCTLALLIAALSFLLALRVSGSWVIAALAASLAALAANFRMQMRPEIFAFVYFLIFLNLMHEFLETRKRLWLAGLLPVGVVWANSHGSFVIGLVLPWLFLAGEAMDDGRLGRLRDAKACRTRSAEVYVPLVATALALFALSLANPYGLRLHRHVLEFGRAEYLREQIVEFGATFSERVRSTPYFKVYAIYLAILVLCLIAGRRRLSAIPLLLFLAFGYLSTDSIRFTAWLALAGTWVLAHGLSASAPKADRTTNFMALTTLLAVATAIVAARGDVRGKRIGFRDESPMSEAAIAFVRSSRIEGNVFNAFNQGDQLVYHFFPRIRVVIDTRIDAYGEAYYRWYRTLEGRSLKQLGEPAALTSFLDRHGVNAIVTRPFDYGNWVKKGHVSALLAEGFSVDYADERTVVLRRRAR